MTRRMNGEGTVPSWVASKGYWRAHYTAANGIRKSVYCSIPGPAGKRECTEKLRLAVDRARAGDLPLPANLTVARYMATWIETWINDADHNGRTVKDYRGVLDNHVAPAIGHRALNGPDRIRGTEIKRMLDRMTVKHARRLGEPVSETTRQHVYDILNACLDRAVIDGECERNPMLGIARPGRDTPRHVPWTTDEAMTFLASQEGDRYEALWYIALTMGLRQGEVIGLRWSDIDWAAGTLTVNGQIDRHTRTWKPKRKGNNPDPLVLRMPDVVVTLLRDRETMQKFEQRRAGRKWTGNPAGYVFTARYGTVVGHNNIGQEWRDAVALVPGLRPVKMHGARHFFASFQYAATADLARVGALLGQRDNGRTAGQVYVHLNEREVAADGAAAANALPLRRRATGS